jgi:uncharacterized repeat protein (TIGR03803 family)
VHAFTPGASGPASGVILARDGNFYGTTWASNSGGGAVFRMTPAGEVTILHEFDSPPWAPPAGATVFPSGLVARSPSRTGSANRRPSGSVR